MEALDEGNVAVEEMLSEAIAVVFRTRLLGFATEPVEEACRIAISESL